MATVTPISTSPVAGVRPASSVRPQTSSPRFHEVLRQQNVGRPAAAKADLAGGVISGIDAGRRRLDEIISQAQAGRTFRPHELLALQAEVYKISEELSLVHKVVEEGVSGMKRLWNLQI